MRVGIDNIEIERLKDLSLDENKLKKLFTKNEIDYFNKFENRIEHIAGFFCVKEAFAKAIKTGFGEKLNPLDIEILHKKNGAPKINIVKHQLKDEYDLKDCEISISHSKTIAMAICILN